MSIRLKQFTFTAAAALILATLPAAGQTFPAYRAPRFPGTENPDLNGIWQAVNAADWDLEPHAAGPSPFPSLLGAIAAEPAGQGVVEGGQIPYQPWARDRKNENFKQRFTHPTSLQINEAAGDPEAKCYLPGVPRATYMPFPFRLVQSSKQVLIAYEFASASRIVYMDRKPKIPADAWMGWSVGHWEGDTLVIDVTSQVDRTWFDRAGNFHSDALHVVERYTPASPLSSAV